MAKNGDSRIDNPGFQHVREMLEWLESIEDPVERLVSTTKMIDVIRNETLADMAAIRRSAAWTARQSMIVGGMPATEATRHLAGKSDASVQTIMRLIQERGSYGG